VIYPGLAQRMSAGTGILHSEKNDSWRLEGGPEHGEPVHFIQMWVAPDTSGIAPGYEQLDINAELDRGGLVPVASGMARHDGASAIRIRQKDAALHAGRLSAGESVALPAAPFLHLFVAVGAIELEGSGTLATGDSARITAGDGRRAVAGPDGAELLVWEMHALLAAG
jgi:redox-sensitive bicupin YhaK (pirin superfamily)